MVRTVGRRRGRGMRRQSDTLRGVSGRRVPPAERWRRAGPALGDHSLKHFLLFSCDSSLDCTGLCVRKGETGGENSLTHTMHE